MQDLLEKIRKITFCTQLKNNSIYEKYTKFIDRKITDFTSTDKVVLKLIWENNSSEEINVILKKNVEKRSDEKV